jgi:hypothetical protein
MVRMAAGTTENIPTSISARNITASDTQTLQTHTKRTHGLTSHQEPRLRWHGPEEACDGPGAEGGAGILIAGLEKRRATEVILEQLSDGQDSGSVTDNIPTSMYARNIAPSDAQTLKSADPPSGMDPKTSVTELVL